jgi:leucyl-tRNA synthetase
MDKAEKELNFWLNNAIKGVTEDGEKMQFNTAIARMMEFINALSKYVQEETKNLDFLKGICESFIKILAPFAPHFAEEQWSLLTGKYSVFNEAWPTYDAKALVKDEIEIAIQVNGKIKARINVASDLDEEGIKAAALADEAIVAATEGKTVVKVIVIKGRLVNIVVK